MFSNAFAGPRGANRVPLSGSVSALSGSVHALSEFVNAIPESVNAVSESVIEYPDLQKEHGFPSLLVFLTFQRAAKWNLDVQVHRRMGSWTFKNTMDFQIFWFFDF